MISELPAAARAEYASRMAKCEALEERHSFTREIAERLHNWQRIAWLLDAPGRAPGEKLHIWPSDLIGMAKEARHCARIAREKLDAEPDNGARQARAAKLYLIAAILETRAESRRAECGRQEYRRAA